MIDAGESTGSGGDRDDLDTVARFLETLRTLAAETTAWGDAGERVAREASEAIEVWSRRSGPDPAVDVSHILRGITSAERELLSEGLTVIARWVRQPGQETGARVDAMIERMRREWGPLIGRDRDAERTAYQERLNASVRESIASRLRVVSISMPPDAGGES